MCIRDRLSSFSAHGKIGNFIIHHDPDSGEILIKLYIKIHNSTVWVELNYYVYSTLYNQHILTI